MVIKLNFFHSFLPRRPIDSLEIAGQTILFSPKERNIGVVLDEDLSLEHQRCCYLQILLFSFKEHLKNQETYER